MNYGIYLSTEGAMALSTRLETLSNNLANAQTTGFKRDLAVAQARFAEDVQQQRVPPGMHGMVDIGGGVEVVDTVTDFSGGPLRETGNQTDLAIGGSGFFVVRRDGRDFLTRAGNFSLSPTGQLITQDGDAVIGEDNEPMSIEPELGPWQFTPDGCLQQGTNRDPLALVMPTDLHSMVKTGDNLFAPTGPVVPLLPDDRRVEVGSIELSSVRPAQEMMDLIATTRGLEANINMIRSQDEMYNSLISRILKS